MPQFSAAGVRVYTLSYDEPDALADFSEAHDITYELLSDPDSAVIRQFGILNTLIAEDDHPWFGIPYPGTYVLDTTGVITHKFFENNLAVRAGPEQLLRAVQGESVDMDTDAAKAQGEVATRVYLDGDSLAVSVMRDLVAEISLPTGRHAYASPASGGTTAVSLEIDDNPGLVMRDLVRPPSDAHSLADSDEVFQVHHGLVQLRLPMTINGRAVNWDEPTITITGSLRYQTCDDAVCDIPQTERFELILPVERPQANLRGNADEKSAEPNAMRHFQRMTTRRQNTTD